MSLPNKFVALAALAVALAAPGLSARAVNFNIDGEILTCNTTVCNAAGIAVGDPISGFFEVSDAAAGPNSTFTEADVITFEVFVGSLGGGPGDSTFGPSSLTTDALGEIVAGTVNIMTSVDTFLGTADVDIDIDAAAGTWTASTDFFGFGTVATGTLTLTREVTDSDGDGIADDADNCTLVANPDQRDSNGDLFGNACDPDLNNDGIVNPLDLGLLKQVFFTADADADFNGDGIVNPVDLGVLSSLFFMAPGPSGLAGP